MLNVAGMNEATAGGHGAADGLPPGTVVCDHSSVQTMVEATTASMNSTASAIPSPLDALALACEHHEQECRAVSSGDTSSAVSTTPHVVPNQNTITTHKPSDRKQNTGTGTGKPTSKPSITVISSAVTEVPSASTKEFKITNNDVLCGRGGLTNHHPGNVMFRSLVRAKQEAYLRATKREKAGVAKEIVGIMRQLDPPGRFLKKDPANPGKWVEIGDKKAREKTSQALREGAPELKARVEGLANSPVSASVIAPSLLAATSITVDEQQQAIQATFGSSPRVRIVSDDSVNITGWTQANVAQYASKQSMAVEGGSMLNIITPLTLTPSTSSSSNEEIDTASNASSEGYSGSKRKVDDQAMQVQQDSPKKSSRGPRMKLLKARMADLCHEEESS